MATATALYVVYETRQLDLSWIPADCPVVIVHNDLTFEGLAPGRVHHITHVYSEQNVGFGAGVNLGLSSVTTERLVLVNPDAVLEPFHWDALAGVGSTDIATVPLVQPDGRETVVVSRYPGPLRVLLSALGAGRVAERGTLVRRLVGPLMGEFSLSQKRTFSVKDYWVSGAVLSLPTDALRAVGGFDERFFLYFEDVDLCERLAAAEAADRIILCDAPSGIHAVGRSPATRQTYKRAAASYAEHRAGLGWAALRALLRP